MLRTSPSPSRSAFRMECISRCWWKNGVEASEVRTTVSPARSSPWLTSCRVQVKTVSYQTHGRRKVHQQRLGLDSRLQSNLEPLAYHRWCPFRTSKWCSTNRRLRRGNRADSEIGTYRELRWCSSRTSYHRRCHRSRTHSWFGQSSRTLELGSCLGPMGIATWRCSRAMASSYRSK